MLYPSAQSDVPPAAPDDIEVGIILVGPTRVRCLFDPDWGSVLCLRIAPGELAQYLGVVAGMETDSPTLYLDGTSHWRFPTPELRERLRRQVIDLYGKWKQAR
ncbi:hypothetical protein [Glycomyces xiaoerkulensis]|uniref:hypothetical protein n=1 Tax=Glycomyces xiaoerkulensis TaxID=2038139 RepID=UPI0013000330|nr:hypothetical protein [Glycomyces xiaoerkulensis]